MADGIDNKDHENIKLISQKHAMIRANTEKAINELSKIKDEFHNEEIRTNEKSAEVCIAEQHLRSLNERFYYVKKEYDEKEEETSELVKQMVNLELKVFNFQKRIAETKVLRENLSVTQSNHKQKVRNTDKRMYPEYETLLKEVEALKNLKQRLDSKDPELEHIINGSTLQLYQNKIEAVHQSMAELAMRNEGIYVEIDEKKDAMDKLQIQCQIEEKQHQARLRKLGKQLNDLQSEESHLESKIQNLEKQIDHKLVQKN